MDPRSWRLTMRVYLALVVLLVVSVAVTAWRWSDGWVQTWMPNFIAEWSGILIAVGIVDRLIDRARQEDEHARLDPLRRVAADALALPLQLVLSGAVNAYALAAGIDSPDPIEPAGVFLQRWGPNVSAAAYAMDTEWISAFANRCREAADMIAGVRAQYLHALEHVEVARLDRAATRLRQAQEQLSGQLIFLDESRRDAMDIPGGLVPPPEVVAGNVGAAANVVAEAIETLADVYQTLAGSELTTAAAWQAWRIEHLLVLVTERLKEGGQGIPT